MSRYSMSSIDRPLPSDYPPYFEKYVSLVPDAPVLATIEAQTSATLALLHQVSEEQSLYRYAPGKWSLRESWLHVADTERIFTYRLLRFARTDPAELQSFDQDLFVGPSQADSRSWASVIAEFEAVRNATIHLLRNLPTDAWSRTGTVGGNTISVRALAFITAGHVFHHVNLTRDRYLAQ